MSEKPEKRTVTAAVAEVIEALSDDAERLDELTEHADERWQEPPRDGGWSAVATLAHLRASDDILTPRLMQIAVRDEPFLASLDERRWQEVAGYAELPAQQLVDGFRARREELLFALGRLPLSSWQRTGTHEDRGRVTLLELAQGLAEHELEHVEQIERALVGGS